VAHLADLAHLAASQIPGSFRHSVALRRASTRTEAFLRRVAFRLRMRAIQTHSMGMRKRLLISMRVGGGAKKSRGNAKDVEELDRDRFDRLPWLFDSPSRLRGDECLWLLLVRFNFRVASL
jgi:hypothetical protein